VSHGRLDFGIGCAYQPHEFHGIGAFVEQGREMFDEGIDITLKSWTKGKFSFRGELWTTDQISIGDIDPAHCERAMRITADRVLPHV